jgi:hypothetical protein
MPYRALSLAAGAGSSAAQGRAKAWEARAAPPPPRGGGGRAATTRRPQGPSRAGPGRLGKPHRAAARTRRGAGRAGRGAARARARVRFCLRAAWGSGLCGEALTLALAARCCCLSSGVVGAGRRGAPARPVGTISTRQSPTIFAQTTSPARQCLSIVWMVTPSAAAPSLSATHCAPGISMRGSQHPCGPPSSSPRALLPSAARLGGELHARTWCARNAPQLDRTPMHCTGSSPAPRRTSRGRARAGLGWTCTILPRSQEPRAVRFLHAWTAGSHGRSQRLRVVPRAWASTSLRGSATI